MNLFIYVAGQLLIVAVLLYLGFMMVKIVTRSIEEMMDESEKEMRNDKDNKS